MSQQFGAAGRKHKAESETCQNKDRNGTTALLLFNMLNMGFSGIPESFIINAAVFIILMTIFIILKKVGSAVKRLDTSRGATDLIDVGSTTQIFYSPPEANFQTERSDNNTSEEYALVREGSGTVSWVSVLFRLNDRHFFKRSGQDAVDYLRFSRYLIIQTGIVMILGLGAILPVNMTGTLRRSYDLFGGTTIANLRAHSFLMWIHVGLVFLLIPLTYFSIRTILKLRLKIDSYKERRLAPYRTLMISNIPDDGLNEDLIRRHFNEAYSNARVAHIDFTYDSEKLMKAVGRKMKYDYCVYYVDQYREQHRASLDGDAPFGGSFQMHIVPCGACFWCCCGRKVEADRFYHDKAAEVGDDMDREYQHAVKTPANVVFVTFESHEAARSVKDDFSATRLCAGRHSRDTSVSDRLQVAMWSVIWAPLPFYVNWPKLSTSGVIWWIRALLINAGLVAMVFFLTTPALLLHMLQDVLPNVPVITQWLPTVLLVIVTFVFLVVIQLSVAWQGYYSKSVEVFTQLRNLFIYLLLILLVLPSIGLTSAEALWTVFLTQSDLGGGLRAASVNWKCVFLPSNGSFFVNFTIAAAFFGNGLTLLRLGGLFILCLRRCWARSDAERAAINRTRAAFAYPGSYAALLVIYSIAVAYSFVCPVVLPCAWIFFIIRHYIDKYNLYYGITPLDNESRLSMGIHTRAAAYLYVPLLLQNLIMLAFSILHGVDLVIVIVYATLALCLLAFLVFLTFFGRYVDLDLVSALRHLLSGGDKNSAAAGKVSNSNIEMHTHRAANGGGNAATIEKMRYEDPAIVQYRKIKSGRGYNVQELPPADVSGINVSSMPPIPI